MSATRTRPDSWLRVLFLSHLAAGLLHHAHNAIWLHDYPNLPATLSVERVLLAWCAQALVGVAGYLLVRSRFRTFGLILLGVFGLFGLLGLAHYHLAVAAAHSLAMNATIALEVLTGISLAFYVGRCLLSNDISTAERT